MCITHINILSEIKKLCKRDSCVLIRPNRTQYNAANIGKGMDANKAPNFPAEIWLVFEGISEEK